jgi:phosphoribosylpyrophosphate synthetase
LAGRLLADAVVPLGYAVRGGALAEDLWRYKSGRAAAAESAARLREKLAGFLRADGDSVWRSAGMPAGPTAVAVVPSGQGRPGAHPLISIVRSCVDLPMVGLSITPEVSHVRGVTVGWLRVDGPVAGADVLVIDDTWVSGGSAQSAAAALKLAGARRVAIVVLGRHVNPRDPRSADFLASLSS